jgi:hypothetical protein
MITSDWGAISVSASRCIPQPAACIRGRLPWLKSSRVFIKPNAVARNRYGYSASTASSDQRAGRGNTWLLIVLVERAGDEQLLWR